MAPIAETDLSAPSRCDTILEIRTSKMKTMPGLQIQTGIDKKQRSGSIPVSFTGLDSDEHDLTFHGGPDKAIHGYCSSHYSKWQNEFPEAASRFVPGGFGENFVHTAMNEENVCIGDIYEVGNNGVRLQVSLPRNPCFKLNHRFQLKKFTPNTTKLSRTGWYYRVLSEGTVSPGDEMRLIERKWPEWTIERIQEYLWRNQQDSAMNEILSQIDVMGDECRGAFQRRVEASKKQKDSELLVDKWSDYRITEKKMQTPRIASFILEAVRPDPNPRDSMYGAAARIRLPNGLVRSYSIVSGEDSNRFELGIALDDNSRGGSSYLHNTAEKGDILEVGRITSDVKGSGASSNHVFIVGGIGITAFLSLMELGRLIHWNIKLHYAVRESDDIPFKERIEGLEGKFGEDGGGQGKVVHIYDKAKGQRIDIPQIFQNLPWNSHVYVCGPSRLMDEASQAAKTAGLGSDDVHFEAFGADTTGDPFDVEVKNRGGKALHVGAEQTLLEVLRKEFGDGDVPSSCEVGNCGTCLVTLKSGRVEHRGSALTDEQKDGSMLSCVSRGVGKILIEI